VIHETSFGMTGFWPRVGMKQISAIEAAVGKLFENIQGIAPMEANIFYLEKIDISYFLNPIT